MIPRYPTLLKLGEYTLDKINFTLTHKFQVVKGTGRKRRIEYQCEECSSIYITSLGNEREKEFPWICRSCRTKHHWTDRSYRKALLSGITDETKRIHGENLRKRSVEMWADPLIRARISKKLRDRDPIVYSKGKSKMRIATIIAHWFTKAELVCVGSYESSFVRWCNEHKIDFDWQIPFKMPDGRTYIVDAFIKSGSFANNWIEIKGYMRQIGREKWEWFHSTQPNSLLWTKPILKSLKIL